MNQCLQDRINNYTICFGFCLSVHVPGAISARDRGETSLQEKLRNSGHERWQSCEPELHIAGPEHTHTHTCKYLLTHTHLMPAGETREEITDILNSRDVEVGVGRWGCLDPDSTLMQQRPRAVGSTHWNFSGCSELYKTALNHLGCVYRITAECSASFSCIIIITDGLASILYFILFHFVQMLIIFGLLLLLLLYSDLLMANALLHWMLAYQ